MRSIADDLRNEHLQEMLELPVITVLHMILLKLFAGGYARSAGVRAGWSESVSLSTAARRRRASRRDGGVPVA